MLHHDKAFTGSLQAEHRRGGPRRGLPLDPGELERALREAASGDEDAWGSLVKWFSGAVRAVARRHRLAHDDVEDIVQTTWLRLYEHVAQVREPAAVGSWLRTTARRESLHTLARASREQPAGEAFAEREAAPPVLDEVLAAERREALSNARMSLSERQQSLLAMLYAEPPASYETVSATLGIPIGSIGPTRSRALARLRADPRLAAVVEPRS